MSKIVTWVGFFGACFVPINANTQKLYSTIKTATNPNFIPAEDIIFYDDFRDCDTGQVPKNWKINIVNRSWRSLEKSAEGAAIKKIKNMPVLRTPEGTWEYLSPLIYTTICDTCYTTMEFDYIHISDSQKKVTINLNYIWVQESWENACCQINSRGKINIGYMHNKTSVTDQEMMYKLYDYSGTYDSTKWHHFVESFYRKNMTLYIDNCLIFKDVYLHLSPVTFNFMYPYYVTNVRIAQTNYKRPYIIDTILKGGKFVTHAIKFDVNQSIIKHESNNFIKQMAEWLQKHPTVRLEIDGYTDNEGISASNLQLSVDRANAIKERLVLHGINETRLTTRGFGASQPVDENTTLQGKANNRRVEFRKL